jgi:CBS domain containing-hemolysin-like protein
LLFSWSSAVVAARNTPASFMQMMATGVPGLPRVARFLRLGSATLTGICAAILGLSLAAGWQLAGAESAWLTVVFIVASTLVATVVLAGLDYGTRSAVRAFPGIGRHVSRPERWLADAAYSHHSNDNSTGSNGNGFEPNEHDPEGVIPAAASLTTDELLNLDQHDIDMVRSISRMDDRDALHIMVPRLDVDAVEVSATLATVVDTLVTSKHTRLPVYRGTMDNVVGIVHISDVLLALTRDGQEPTLASIMREPEFIAENMAVDDLLQLMRAKSLQMGIVVDEYGGVEGVVTLEDILEEIVGEIEDEFTDASHGDAVAAPDGSWILNATLPIQDVEKAIGVSLDDRDTNTIGGYVYTELGRMPEVGDVVETPQVAIEVTQVRGRRIQQLRVRRVKGGSASAQGSGLPSTRAALPKPTEN